MPDAPSAKPPASSFMRKALVVGSILVVGAAVFLVLALRAVGRFQNGTKTAEGQNLVRVVDPRSVITRRDCRDCRDCREKVPIVYLRVERPTGPRAPDPLFAEDRSEPRT